MIMDYSSWEEYKGASEGSGRSEKIWLINGRTKEIGLFKYTKSEKTKEHVSEKLAADLARLLGLQSARIEIGKYNARIGSMSYRINKDDETLIEGIYFINSLYPEYDSNTLFDFVKNEYYSLEMIINSIKGYNLVTEFLKIVVFDFLIGNTDRHQNNWAVLENVNGIRICPMYDNSSSLCCYLPEEDIDSYLSNDKIRFNSLVDSKSRSRIRISGKIKKEPTHMEMLQYIKCNYRDHVENLVRTISTVITEIELNKILLVYPEDLLSIKRKKLIKMFLLEKVKMIENTFLREEE